jgi:cytidylate kinase
VSRKPNIAIDGPAGSGKSTVARELADRLNLRYRCHVPGGDLFCHKIRYRCGK